jgi:hypothetical protein
MKMRPACFFVLLFVVLLQALNAQEATSVPCDQVAAIAHMARANSLAVLIKAKRNAGTSYRAEVVFGARSFELQPGNIRAAITLLKLIPQDDEQHLTLMTLGESLCDGESVAEMMSQSRIGEHLSRDFSKAILLVPEMLPKYVAYASTSVHDPHSDYAVQMQTVCRAKHAEFVKAVEGLPTDQRDWFVKHVFNPDGCHALALPEAE